MKYIFALFLVFSWIPVYAAEIDTEIDTTHRGYDLPAEVVPGYTPVLPAEYAEADSEGQLAPAEEPISDTLLMIGIGIYGNNKPLRYNDKSFTRQIAPAIQITMNRYFSKYFGLGFSLSHIGGETKTLHNYIAANDSYHLEYRYFSGALLTSFRYPLDNIEPFLNLGVTYDIVQVEEHNEDTSKMDHKETDQAIGVMLEGGLRYTLASDLVAAASIRYNYTQNDFHEDNDINFGGAQAYLSVGYYF